MTLIDRLRGLLGLAPASVREDIEDALDDAAADVTRMSARCSKTCSACMICASPTP